MVSTVLPGLATKVIEKTLKITADRLAPAGATIVAERRVPHEREALAKALDEVLKAGAELAIVFGASAIADRRDVIPAALEEIGGTRRAFRHAGRSRQSDDDRRGRQAPGDRRAGLRAEPEGKRFRLGADAASRRPAGVARGHYRARRRRAPHGNRDTAAAARRAGCKPASSIAAIVLGAGRSSRMGGPNKLLAEINGKPLIRMVVEQALASQARPVVVVTGHQRERVEAALAGLPVKFVHNPHFADGLGTSLKAGIAALPAEVDGAIVCLGDMPQVDAALIDRLIGAIDPDKGALIAVPVIDGKRGNPVVWSRRFFPDLMTVEGDIGARYLIGRYAEAVAEVPVDGTAALTDVDTPEALRGGEGRAGKDVKRMTFSA